MPRLSNKVTSGPSRRKILYGTTVVTILLAFVVGFLVGGFFESPSDSNNNSPDVS